MKTILIITLLLGLSLARIDGGRNCGVLPKRPSTLVNPAVPPAGLTLEHVTIVVRHGDRAPLAHGPGYACWPNADAWECESDPEELPVVPLPNRGDSPSPPSSFISSHQS